MDFIKQYRNKLIIAAVIVAVLITAFIAGGRSGSNSNSYTEEITVTDKPVREKDTADTNVNITGDGIIGGITPQIAENTDTYVIPSTEPAAPSSEGAIQESGSIGYSQAAGMEIDEKTGTDEYGTYAVPEGMPVPAEPQEAVITDTELTCYLTVRCDTILNNMSRLKPEKISLVPEDGIIYPKQKVVFYEGESVFNVLIREMKKNKIHFEYTDTPMYNSAYIEGINNLYEFDCGQNSGWMYMVNGWVPNYGVSRYELHSGDDVVFVYTCDNGRDIVNNE